MRKLLPTTMLLAALGAGSANAADLPVYKAPAIWTWTGMYFGGHVGYGWGNEKWYDIFPTPDLAVDADNGLNGFLGGPQVGYRYQMNWLVLGIQADYSWSGVGSAFNCFSFGNQVCTARKQWFSTLTGSIGGLITPQALLYVKGGGAAVRDQYTDLALSSASRGGVPSVPGVTFEADQTRLGYDVGAGFEYMFTRNWSAFIEYDYMNFGSKVVNFNSGIPNAFFPELIKQDAQLVEVGFNYKLDWGLAAGGAPSPSTTPMYFKAPARGGNAEEPAYHWLAFSGLDATSHSVDGWVGGLYSPTSDLDSYGPRIYVLGGAGGYKYPEESGVQNKGVYETGDLLGGWGFEGHNYSANVLAGLSVENDTLRQADPNNPVQGTRVGAKVRVDGWINPTAQSLLYEEGEYSTAFNTYYVGAKAGYDFLGNTGIFIGPEVAALGDDRYDQGRIGAHVTQMKFGKVQLDISGGFLHDTSTGNGGYGRVELSTNFQ